MRESGFYWVQFNVGDWRVAYWTDYSWQVGAAAGYWDDEDMMEIDERRIERGAEQQRDELLAAAEDAATSLETIQLRSFGEDSFLDSKAEMRSYAGSRAAVARDAISKAKAAQAGEGV